jgi:glycosyltransferase involved in cell wall biosynthesis
MICHDAEMAWVAARDNGGGHRVTVVSHACVLPSNQAVYEHLDDDLVVTLVVPSRWRDELRPQRYAARADAGWLGGFVPIPTIGLGRPQRHVALTRWQGTLVRLRSTFVVIEEEPFSLSALAWSLAARRLGVPYAVQVAENLDRPLPMPAVRACRHVLGGAAFVLARSPGALAQARRWGYGGPDTVVPHSVTVPADVVARPIGVVGVVGRVVAAKGVTDVVAALAAHPELTARVAGDGPMRAAYDAAPRVTVLGTLDPSAMDAFYDSVSVVAVPSRTTPTWTEQFGRVVIEAQARGRRVVAYDSGELPWVASLTAATIVTEGDVTALGDALVAAATDNDVTRALVDRGRAGVATHFSHHAVGTQLSGLMRSASPS